MDGVHDQVWTLTCFQPSNFHINVWIQLRQMQVWWNLTVLHGWDCLGLDGTGWQIVFKNILNQIWIKSKVTKSNSISIFCLGSTYYANNKTPKGTRIIHKYTYNIHTHIYHHQKRATFNYTKIAQAFTLNNKKPHLFAKEPLGVQRYQQHLPNDSRWSSQLQHTTKSFVLDPRCCTRHPPGGGFQTSPLIWPLQKEDSLWKGLFSPSESIFIHIKVRTSFTFI